MNFTGDMDAFAEYFMNDEGNSYLHFPGHHFCLCFLFPVSYAPYFPHLLEAWNLRHHPNLKFIFFEDLKKVLELHSS